MSGQLFRNPSGGSIDRSQPLNFSFDGRRYQGFRGDSLAAALLANGVHLVGRSFKYHRPRGIFSAGPEEPNALVQLRTGARTEPNVRATQVELFDGLVAESQNRWPSVDRDVGAVTGAFSRMLPAGFYYKTFMWPPSLWTTYERFIRRAAGMGRAPTEPDPDRYEKCHAHCDVLVVGGGPAGLAAALAAGRTGARVILADEGPELGGALLYERAEIDGAPALDWVRKAAAELAELPETTVLRRSTVFGYYDHDFLGIVEGVADHQARPGAFQPRQRLWKVRAGRVVLATGAIERPLVFPDNDRPGIMLASAARAYANRFAVRAGSRAVVFTNNDSAYAAAADLAASGVEIAAIIDLREGIAGALASQAGLTVPCHSGAAVVGTYGRKHLKAIDFMALNAAGDACVGQPRRIDCDLLCISGGWNPVIHLHAQAQGRPAYDEEKATFIPGPSVQAECSVGAASGTFSVAGCLTEGFRAGAAAAHAAGFGDGEAPPAPSSPSGMRTAPRAIWSIPLPPKRHAKRFVDLQNDVTANDIALAAREGYRSVELVKRYTTLGMGTDQGKTSNVNGLGILAQVLEADIPSTGTTTFRPPYAPVTLGALAGREGGERFDPVRLSPVHDWHVSAGAVFMPSGLWLRPKYYPRPGETMVEAVQREARAVRSNVGLVDVSTLGKIDIQGPDAAEFLDRIYINGWKTLKVGRARYGIMLREDGVVFDDGTTTRLGEHHFLMTTTTANAGRVMAHLEFHLQMVWPELRVHPTPVTDQWAAMALSGPKSRELLAQLFEGTDVSNEALPFMGFTEGKLGGTTARIFRISFSGERAYEINVPADYGLAAWTAVMEAGAPMGIVPYGLEAMEVLRIEKGHLVVGAEIDGRVTPMDLGFAGMLSTKKDFIGRRALARRAFGEPDRQALVGLRPADGKTPIPIGAQIVADAKAPSPNTSLGRVTSTHFSPTLDSPIALALVAGGLAREGETLFAVSPLTSEQAEVTVTKPVFVDPAGERLHG